jgi:hypothetical protein
MHELLPDGRPLRGSRERNRGDARSFAGGLGKDACPRNCACAGFKGSVDSSFVVAIATVFGMAVGIKPVEESAHAAVCQSHA